MNFQVSWNHYISLIEFAYNNSFQATIGVASYKLLYGRKCRSSVHWDEARERRYLGPNIIRNMAMAVENIKKCMLVTQDRQKFYADPKRRPLEFSIGDKVFLKVALMKGIMRFGKKGKLIPRFIGPFEIFEKVENVAYRLALPPELSSVHNVVHVSMLRKYISNPAYVLSQEPLALDLDLSYDGLFRF